jgi:WD40 repeat protein
MKRQLSVLVALSAVVSLAVGQVTRTKTFYQLHVIAYAAAPSGSRFAAALEDHSVRIMNAANGTTLKVLKGHPQPVYALAFSPNGRILATGDESARIWLWDVASGKRVGQLPAGHQRGIQNLSFSPDGKRLASTGKDDVIRIYDAKSGKIVATLYGRGANFYSATFMENSGILAAATLGSGVHLYSTKGFKPIGRIEGHNKLGIMDIALFGSRAITGGRDGIATYWNMQSKTPIVNLRGHGDWVIHVALSPNGHYAATSSNDRSVIVWDLTTRKAIAKLENQCFVGSPLAFTADGKYLLTASDSDALQIYALSSEGKLATRSSFEAHRPQPKPTPKQK